MLRERVGASGQGRENDFGIVEESGHEGVLKARLLFFLQSHSCVIVTGRLIQPPVCNLQPSAALDGSDVLDSLAPNEVPDSVKFAFV